MKTITLYRKKGPPWVFEWSVDNKEWVHKTRYGNIYELFMCSGIYTEIWIGRQRKQIYYHDVTKQIHASHFKLGNVTITFD